MIPTPVAVRMIAELIDVRIQTTRPYGALLQRLTDARDRLLAAVGPRHRQDRSSARHAAHRGRPLPAAADPAAVGYLCAWVSGHYEAWPALVEYLGRRLDPRHPAVRDASPHDTAALVLAALADPPAG